MKQKMKLAATLMLLVLGACAEDGGNVLKASLCSIGANACKQRCGGPMPAEEALECRKSCADQCSR